MRQYTRILFKYRNLIANFNDSIPGYKQRKCDTIHLRELLKWLNFPRWTRCIDSKEYCEWIWKSKYESIRSSCGL
jgi:hypothetical protein